MSLDTNGRRLLTASEGGTIKIWNYSSGYCLKECQTHTATEVTGVLSGKGPFSGSFLLSVGWDKSVTLFEDEKSDQFATPYRTLQGHRSDILTACLSGSSGQLATGSEDGSLFLWGVDSGSIKAKFRSPLPGEDVGSVEHVRKGAREGPPPAPRLSRPAPARSLSLCRWPSCAASSPSCSQALPRMGSCSSGTRPVPTLSSSA